ncbi:Polyketide cyclase/dehydrase and lipid transport superfamily protein [Rhynchospora pubera]|nr:Polyketide cyclase/dehydrase and lipid transport superfamily protein [Rhynchospora pubera]KAJ4767969.1 Polyketide cyclase/dehydrase and lipid transport superfamily protein [Rhynchospora pubera]KAJ4820659.1 Polyketide cyclase/dehydrase and lipid transport superfamily protein [Rhynchospora pubera]
MERMEGKVTATVHLATAEQAWTLLSNFCDFHSWHPGVKICRKESGTLGVPGCIRYCQGLDKEDGIPADWANEELLSFDATGHAFSYKMMENNMGFGQFTATFRVVDSKKEGLNEGKGCEIEWSFEGEPIKGTTKEALIARLQAGLTGMAKRVDEVISQLVPKAA